MFDEYNKSAAIFCIQMFICELGHCAEVYLDESFLNNLKKIVKELYQVIENILYEKSDGASKVLTLFDNSIKLIKPKSNMHNSSLSILYMMKKQIQEMSKYKSQILLSSEKSIISRIGSKKIDQGISISK